MSIVLSGTRDVHAVYSTLLFRLFQEPDVPGRGPVLPELRRHLLLHICSRHDCEQSGRDVSKLIQYFSCFALRVGYEYGNGRFSAFFFF